MSVLVALLVALGRLSAAAVAGPGASDRPEPDQRLVLVELFTSQGCSSCPPADRLLAQLGDERVVALAFHVDYWNRLGWRDPFSSELWTRRQQAYAGALGHGRVYTPQAVIDGRTDAVGSEAQRVREAVAMARRRPAARIAIEPAPPSGARAPIRLAVTRPESLRDRRLDLMVAIYEDGLATAVASGENARRTLRNERVVRALVRALELPAGGAAQARVEIELALDPAWERSRLGVAAFVQDPETLGVEGAAASPLPAIGSEGRGSGY
jgi:hypothetical protein